MDKRINVCTARPSSSELREKVEYFQLEYVRRIFKLYISYFLFAKRVRSVKLYSFKLWITPGTVLGKTSTVHRYIKIFLSFLCVLFLLSAASHPQLATARGRDCISVSIQKINVYTGPITSINLLQVRVWLNEFS